MKMNSKIQDKLINQTEKFEEKINPATVRSRLDLAEKTEECINSFSGQNYYGLNIFPFRYSTGLIPQSN